jgi:hypothetical protein
MPDSHRPEDGGNMVLKMVVTTYKTMQRHNPEDAIFIANRTSKPLILISCDTNKLIQQNQMRVPVPGETRHIPYQ